MIVVSDTSPIRALTHLHLIGSLESVFGEVWIPPGVVSELAQDVPGMGPVDPALWSFFHVHAPGDAARVAQLRRRLGRGEAEAIVLAVEQHAAYVLIDETSGRGVAKSLGLTPLGTLGVLVRCKELGLITAVAPLIEQLRTGINFRVSEGVRVRTLRLADELPEGLP